MIPKCRKSFCFVNFGSPFLSLARVKLETSNLVHYVDRGKSQTHCPVMGMAHFEIFDGARFCFGNG